MRLAFLLKLSFTLDDPPQALALLRRQREATTAWLARQRARATDATTNAAPPTLALLTLRQRILLSEATLAWLDETGERLNAGRAPV